HEADITAENDAYHQLGVSTLCYFNPYVLIKYTRLFNECLTNGYFLKNNSQLPYLFSYDGDIISRHFLLDNGIKNK
ncbi:unnamed protein product, partial [Didymodactylos carnosus]